MNGGPPPLPPRTASPVPQHPISLRLATAANVFLPGAGLFLVGDKSFGGTIATLFLACFLGVAGLFLNGYANYLKTALGDDLLKGDQLERIGEGFHRPWLLAFAAGGILLYAISTVRFAQVKRRLAPPGPAPGS